MQLIEQTTIFKKLSYKDKFLCRDTNAHIEDNVRMFEVTDNHDFFHKIFTMSMFCSFKIIFYSYLLAYVLAFVDFAVTTLTDQL